MSLALPPWLAALDARFQLVALAKSVAWAALVYGGFTVVVALLERWQGRDLGRYARRHFANDVAYTLLYKASLYKVLLLAVVTNWLDARFPVLRQGLLHDWPWPVGLALFWVGGDFLTYWWHRLQHHNRFLWALHSVHHSQEHLTLLSASRRHPLENLSMDVLIYFVVFHAILGIPTQGWAPLLVFVTCVAALQHSDLELTFGPLERVFVSPQFHRFHHSAEGRHAHANYAFLFSAWDHLFGTAVTEPGRPARYGVPGVDFGESLLRQFVGPFQLMWRWRQADPAPLSPEPADAAVPAGPGRPAPHSS